MRPYGVDVVLLTWNSQRLLPRVIAALQSQVGVETQLHVVDNGSTDGSADWIAQHASPATLIRNRSNTGFAAACNQGIAAGTQQFVQLLNHDVVLAPDYCVRLCEALLTPFRRGSATGKLLQEKSLPPTIDSTGHVVWRSGHAFNRGEGEVDTGQFDDQTDVFGVTAAAAMYLRDALLDTAVDGEIFPEAFFAYGEDVDLDYRLRWRGWSAVYVPTAVAYHARSAGGAKRVTRTEDIVRRNHVLLLVREFDGSWLRRHSGETIAHVLKDTIRLVTRPRRLAFVRMVVGGLPSSIHARRQIRSRRAATPDALHRWLVGTKFGWLPFRWRHVEPTFAGGVGVTVVIVCRNQSAQLAETIESALHQTTPASEIILVDNGSDDLTEETAAQFRDQVRYIRTTLTTTASARNEGLKAAQGEFIVFLRPTDRPHRRFFEIASESLRSDGTKRLAGVYVQALDSGDTRAADPVAAFDIRGVARWDYAESVTMYRRPTRVFPFDKSVGEGCEDWAAWLRLVARGYQLTALDRSPGLKGGRALTGRVNGLDATLHQVVEVASMAPGFFVRHPSVLLAMVTGGDRGVSRVNDGDA